VFCHSCWGCYQFSTVVALAQFLSFCVVIVAVVVASGFGLSYHFHIIDHAFVWHFVLNRHSLSIISICFISLSQLILSAFVGYFLLIVKYRMIRALSESQITETEAVYLCLFDRDMTLDLKMALVIRIHDVNYSMFAYLYWLVFRWYPIYATSKTHLPRRIAK